MSRRMGRGALLLTGSGVLFAGAALWVLSVRGPRGFELTDEARILAANAKDPAVAASLASTALDPRETSAKRYVALRRLESQAPARALEVAEKLTTSTDDLLRCNAVAVLVRSHEPGAPAALERARHASPSNDALATQLASAERKGGN